MELREPPAKKRKSRFGPQPTQDQPAQSNPVVGSDLVKRQQQALAVAAALSKNLGLDDTAGGSSQSGGSSFDRSSGGLGGMRPRPSGHMHYGGEHEEKVYIPTENYPHINFIGLILGPQGMNQKRMQYETGCRLLVKGRGSSKHGDHNLNNDPNEPLHVWISADTREKVQVGVKVINDLLRDSTEKYDEGGMEVKEHRHDGVIDLEIPNTQIGVVIGKMGSNIQRIQEMTGAKMEISPQNVPNNPMMKMITVSGTPDQMEHALSEVYKTIQELRQYRAKQRADRERRQRGGLGYHDRRDNYHDRGHFPNRERYGGYGDHRNYGTAQYDPNFVYPEPVYEEDMLPKIASGAPESGFCEVVIPNTTVGLIIGKGATHVKAMKDRTRCDIRVQKDEDTRPGTNTRLVALRGCVQSIKAARQEIAKVLHGDHDRRGAPNQSGATLQSMQQQNYQQQMMYQQQMYQQMMYQQQMGYGQPYGQYPQGYGQQAVDPAQQQQMQAYYAQWQQHQAQQQQVPQPPPQPPNQMTGAPQQPAPPAPAAAAPTAAAPVAPAPTATAPNTVPAATTGQSAETVQNQNANGQTAVNGAAQQVQAAAPAANGQVANPAAAAGPTPATQGVAANGTNATTATNATAGATVSGATPVATNGTAPVQAPQAPAPAAMTPQEQQYQQMMQSYGWTPQQIAAYQQQCQQYPQYYQQQYAQYYQQNPQYAQYNAAMQQQMAVQQQAPPPPPPPEEPKQANVTTAPTTAVPAAPAPTGTVPATAAPTNAPTATPQTQQTPVVPAAVATPTEDKQPTAANEPVGGGESGANKVTAATAEVTAEKSTAETPAAVTTQ